MQMQSIDSMKLTVSSSDPNYSPHQNTMDRKPLGESKEQDQNIYYGGHQSPPPLPVMTEDYYGRWPEQHASPDGSNNWGQQAFLPHGQHQHQHQFGSPYYAQSAAHVYSNHHAVSPHAYYHHPQMVQHSPPVLPGQLIPAPSYLGRQPRPQHRPLPASGIVLPPRSSPPIAIAHPNYQALDSRGSLSGSYSSTDTLGSSAKRRHGRRQRRGAGGGGGAPRHGGGHGGTATTGGGSPPNRAWYRYDDSTTLCQMRGRVVEIAKDRDGSKFIQRRLQAADYAEMSIAFEEATADIEELWNDVYGNYILQGLLELGTEEMRDRIAQKIVDSGVVSLSTKVYGCRLIQKALDTLDKEAVANIVASVKGKVWLLVHDHNGNHVIQKSVTKINEFFHQSPRRGANGDDDYETDAETALLLASLNIIVDEVTNNIADLSVHPYGCRVVQRLIENCTGAQKARVLDGVADGGLFPTLIEHEYGNYVVQRILAYGRAEDRAAVYDAISANILKLSKQKHSSNVVEMMLTYGDEVQKRAIIDEIITCYCVDQNFVNKRAAVAMAEDAYANYVMKTALDILEEGPTRERLFGILLSSLPELEKSPFAKQVILRVKAYSQESKYE